jgi:hypothetical protein
MNRMKSPHPDPLCDRIRFTVRATHPLEHTDRRAREESGELRTKK